MRLLLLPLRVPPLGDHDQRRQKGKRLNLFKLFFSTVVAAEETHTRACF